MGALEQAIDQYNLDKAKKVPRDVLEAMARGTEEVRATGVEGQALGVGHQMPDFELTNQHGEARRFSDLLAKSPVVLNVYRGGWCPYCNLEMKALHDALDDIKGYGAQLVGMAPETPDKATSTAERHQLEIDILSDPGNQVSARLGLVFELPAHLRPIYEGLGIDIPGYNGDDSFTLPVPATYIVRQDGTVAHAFVNADYTKRLEPAEIVRHLQSGIHLSASTAGLA
jgi:peroxiredoxin